MADGYTITPAGNSGANYSEMSLTFNVSTVDKTPNSFILECSNNNGYVDDCAGSVLVAGSFASNVEFAKQLELNGYLASIESTVQSIANDNALEHAQEAVITAQDNAIALVNAAKQEAADADNALELKIDGKLASQKQALQQEIHAGYWATIARVDNGDAANKTLIDANTTKLGNIETNIANKADSSALNLKADITYVNDEIAKIPSGKIGVCASNEKMIGIDENGVVCEAEYLAKGYAGRGHEQWNGGFNLKPDAPNARQSYIQVSFETPITEGYIVIATPVGFHGCHTRDIFPDGFLLSAGSNRTFQCSILVIPRFK